jgi:flagellar biosynthesis/type III secretory pathway M-ring protein FliF/YscJ
MPDDRTQYREDAPADLAGRKQASPFAGSWGMAALVGAVVLIAAILIFSAAGPDRSRTAENNTIPSSQQPRSNETGEAKAKVPNQNMPTAPQ